MRNNLLTKELFGLDDKASIERTASWNFFGRAYGLNQMLGDNVKMTPKISIDHVKQNLRGKKIKVRGVLLLQISVSTRDLGNPYHLLMFDKVPIYFSSWILSLTALMEDLETMVVRAHVNS
ncbi:hypothetical protein Zmor_002363 [Zophobas morio]|uniref:Uncharacterized protein n=1 Tax=Zophobas morio TaxID=2755281 RepID=A0AA38J0H1_9CUCU|nr:hypothetical protein Zmor_002363 [Zophobas morio]